MKKKILLFISAVVFSIVFYSCSNGEGCGCDDCAKCPPGSATPVKQIPDTAKAPIRK